MPVPWQAVEHGIKRDFRFQACKGSAQAEVDSTPESDMAIWLPLNVEAIGIGELGFVAVRRANPGHDHLTWLDALVANNRLGYRHARHSFHWRVIAQGLLDGPGTSARFLRRRSTTPGFSSKQRIILPSRLVVVSLPATSNRPQKPSSSTLLNRCPSTSAASSALTRSFCGCWRRSSSTCVK